MGSRDEADDRNQWNGQPCVLTVTRGTQDLASFTDAHAMMDNAMSDSKKREPMQCHSCLTEIDPNENQAIEVVNYLLHFCGYACYAEWIGRSDTSTPDGHK
mgnify:FL=1